MKLNALNKLELNVSDETEVSWGEIDSSIVTCINKTLDALQSYPSNDSVIDLSIRLLNILRYLKQDNMYAKKITTENLDLFTPLLIATSQIGISIDLFAYLFAYCSIHRELQPLIYAFIKKEENEPKVKELLKELCISDQLYMTGFYSVIFKLEQFEDIDKQMISYLDMQLGNILYDSWLPLWKRHLESFPSLEKKTLKESLLNDSLLLSITRESDLDFVISTKARNASGWEELKNERSRPIDYFLYKIACRAIRLPKHLPQDFYKFCTRFITTCVKNDSFENLEDDVAFSFQILMEIIDHPELNFLEEPHLTMLLRVSLEKIWELCSRGNFQMLHLKLGELGTTESFPALANILQYLLARFILNLGNVVLSGKQYLHKGDDWFKDCTKYGLPLYFDDIVPKIPPISKSLFSFDDNIIERPQESNNIVKFLNALLESLNLILLINNELINYYATNDVDSLMLPCGSNVKDDVISSIEHKVTLKYLELYHIATITTLLVSEQLLDPRCQMIFIGERESKLNSKLIFRNGLKYFESLIINHKNIALYHLIKFVSKISVEELMLQKKSIQLLNHLFFHGGNDGILQLCLKNELSIQSLHNYIILWNDGSSEYTKFFTDLFKTVQPNVDKTEIELVEISRYIPGFQEDCMSNSRSGTPSTIMESSPTQTPNPKPTVPKFNAYANSFIPSSKSTCTPLMSPSDTPHNQYFPPQQTQKQHQQSSNYYQINNTTPIAYTNVTPTASTPVSDAFPQQQFTNFYSAPNTVVRSTPTRHDRYGSGSSKATPTTTWSSPSFTQQAVFPNNGNKVVNTGKNYILGGHNRVVNSSRAQSIHVDEFEKIY